MLEENRGVICFQFTFPLGGGSVHQLTLPQQEESLGPLFLVFQLLSSVQEEPDSVHPTFKSL